MNRSSVPSGLSAGTSIGVERVSSRVFVSMSDLYCARLVALQMSVALLFREAVLFQKATVFRIYGLATDRAGNGLRFLEEHGRLRVGRSVFTMARFLPTA